MEPGAHGVELAAGHADQGDGAARCQPQAEAAPGQRDELAQLVRIEAAQLGRTNHVEEGPVVVVPDADPDGRPRGHQRGPRRVARRRRQVGRPAAVEGAALGHGQRHRHQAGLVDRPQFGPPRRAWGR